jgi:hypothetical protein
MEIVVDAQVVCWHYQSDVLDLETECSTCPDEVFARLGVDDVAFLDEDGVVEAEWRRKVDPDWFDIWIAERMTAGGIVVIPVTTCKELVRKLRNDAGFPATGTDKWYVCVARSRVIQTGQKIALVSEDADFFEPKVKNNGKARRKALRSGKGGVAKVLRKHDIDPRTVEQHLNS